MRSRTFCMKFNFEQRLFKAFCDAMRIFGGVDPQTESTSPFLYLIIFQRWESFEPSNFTLGEDRHKRSRTFLYEIQFQTTFIQTFFDGIRIFGIVEPQIECILPLIG